MRNSDLDLSLPLMEEIVRKTIVNKSSTLTDAYKLGSSLFRNRDSDLEIFGEDRTLLMDLIKKVGEEEGLLAE